MTQSAALLLRCTPAPSQTPDIDALTQRLRTLRPGLVERVDVNRARDGAFLYVYLWLAAGRAAADTDAALLHESAVPVLPGSDLDVLCLQPVLDVAGASAGEQARFHYVVETDIAPATADELIRWYAEEHLPGLARVPGNIRSRRLQTPAGNGMPRSVACYDLTVPETLERDAWLAVRGTEWSSRVRPHFCNTRRVMFERLATHDYLTGTP